MNPHEKESSPRPPRSVILTVASRCNLRCRHCWPDCGPGAKPFFLSEDVFRRLVDEFAREGARSVTVTGGEPLLHPRWLSMLEFCRRHPGLDEVCLQTNGTLLTEDKVEALASLDGKELLVQVSLDGASAEAHDFVRGEGSFARALRGVELLVEKGLGRRTRLAFTEMAHNFDDLPRLLERVCEWGLKGLVSGTLVRSGRALEASGVSLPRPSQYRRLLHRYLADEAFKERYEALGSVSAIEWYKGRDGAEEAPCRCMEHLYLAAGGTLYPCPMLQAPAYGVKGVLEESVRGVLARAAEVWAPLPRIRQQRVRQLESCRQCPGFLHCKGGCMGRAHAARGRFWAVEDRCGLRQAVYRYGGARD